jgi:hypothetical protein
MHFKGGTKNATANNPAILGWSYVFGIEDNPDVITFTLTNGDSTLTGANALDGTTIS